METPTKVDLTLTQDFLKKPPKARKLFKPKYKNVIFIKNNKLGYEGEVLLAKAPLANFLIGKKRAVDDTPESREIYINSKSEEYWKEIEVKRKKFNFMKIISSGVLKFYRRVDSYDHFIYPVTKMDICNKSLQTLKVVINPEQVEWEKNLKKPGLWWF
jgi:ribosomal protein L9